ncbi:MAG: Chromosome partition protein Smc [Synergistetes bacterium ADurb.BinA166]|nr:MAG: Chromosome partition protein Smc [Synergistetes bacterium ADurb.BinA166]
MHFFFRRRQLEERGESLAAELRELKAREAALSGWRSLWDQARSVLSEGRVEQEGRVARLSEKKADLLSRREALRRSCFASATSIREILSRRRALSADLADLSSRIESLSGEEAALREREAALDAEMATLASERDRLAETAERRRLEIEQERIRREEAAARSAALTGELEVLRSRMRSRRSLLEASAADLAAADEAAQAAERSLRDAGDRRSLLQSEERELSEAHSEIFARCRTTAGLLQTARKEAATLENALEELRSAEDSSYPEPVRFLVAASRLGRLSTTVKIAAEAFTCPPSLSTAVEAYLGGRQFWLLVDTLADAGRCIDMLKERRAGRATFLPLERSRPRSPIHRFPLPDSGVVGWAADLLTAEPRWSPAVMHLLGDLLVVDGYEVGAEIARRGASFPVVSLEGEVFATGGTVSGGRSRSSAGAIERRNRALEAERRLGDCRARVEELTGVLAREEELEQRRAAERDECARSMRELDAGIAALEDDLRGAVARSDRLADGSRDASAELSAWEARESELAKQVEELAVEIGRAAGDLALSLPAELAGLEARCSLAGERLAGARALRERSSGELARARADLTALEEEGRGASEREKGERERLSLHGRELYRLFLDLRELQQELDSEAALERSSAARSARVSSRALRAAERCSEAAAKEADLARRLDDAEEELRRLLESADDEHRRLYDPSLAPGPEEGQALAAAVRRLERELTALGPVDWGALSEDASLSSRVTFLSGQLADVGSAIEELRAIIAETDRYVASTFSSALDSINLRFDALFRRLFGGGEARLQLAAGPDEASGQGQASEWDRGVEIVARPPGKHMQYLAQLSGGEQTLTAIAYLFASMEAAGLPLAVLDEVDAALDESNLLRFGELAREYASPSAEGSGGIQLIVMTHRRATMERADILYGVTLDEPGLSKAVGIRVEDWVEPGQERQRRLRAPAQSGGRA